MSKGYTVKKLISVALRTSLMFFCLFAYENKQEHIIIRALQIEDLASILELDRAVTFEFFKPLYTQHYAHLPIGKDPDRYLELELEKDRQLFHQLTKTPMESMRLYGAWNPEIKACIGLILFHNDADEVHIDCLLVAKEYRRLSIGKRLLNQAVTAFKNSKSCIVYPLKFGNDETLKFYQSYGFVNVEDVPHEKKNSYGISYHEMYFKYKLLL